MCKTWGSLWATQQPEAPNLFSKFYEIFTSVHFFIFWMRLLGIPSNQLHHRLFHDTLHPCEAPRHAFLWHCFEFWSSGDELKTLAFLPILHCWNELEALLGDFCICTRASKLTVEYMARPKVSDQSEGQTVHMILCYEITQNKHVLCFLSTFMCRVGSNVCQRPDCIIPQIATSQKLLHRPIMRSFSPGWNMELCLRFRG